MRLVTFRPPDGRPRAGVPMGEALIDLEAAAPLVFEDAERMRWDLMSILESADEDSSLAAAEEVALAVVDQLGLGGEDALVTAPPGGLQIGGAAMLLPFDGVKLLAPLPRPASLRLFDSFEQHTAAVFRQVRTELPLAWYDQPNFAFGNTSAMIGPDEPLPMPRTRALDYELTLACVIGRPGRDIAEEDAFDYVAGFMIMNDWTARDLQVEALALGLGAAKSKDFATSLGPWFVTPDELEELALPDGRHNLAMMVRVNGVERSRGNARDSFYTFGQLIARASQDVTLVPGDLISSGCVDGGCLLDLTEGRGPWLTPDDLVELSIRGLGTLSNRVV